MKKQILILVVALFAVTAAFGQLTPRTLTCVGTEGPLNPTLGKTYDYSVTVNTTDFTGPLGVTYRWFVTKDKTFYSGGAWATQLPAAGDFDVISAGGTYNSTTNTASTIQLSWNTAANATDPFFLVVTAAGDNGICTPKNTMVYKIIPINSFTLDVANYDITNSSILGTWIATAGPTLGDAPSFTQCISDIATISWPSGSATDPTLKAIYDYGENTLIWAVAAANWTTSWNPTLQISGVNANEHIKSVTWSRTHNGTANGSFSLSGTDWTLSSPITPVSATDPNVGSAGETIYIRMVLDHSDDPAGKFFDGTVDQTITLAINAVTANNDPDVHYSSAEGTGTCATADSFDNDVATQVLKKRPTITSNTSTGSDPFLIPVIK